MSEKMQAFPVKYTTRVALSPTECPKKAWLVDQILSGGSTAEPPKPKATRIRRVRGLCPPMKDCAVCSGGPCVRVKRL